MVPEEYFCYFEFPHGALEISYKDSAKDMEVIVNHFNDNEYFLNGKGQMLVKGSKSNTRLVPDD